MEPTDHELLDAARAGDDTAYAELWRRHHDGGLRAARAISPTGEPEDLVAEAFARILALLREGKGPRDAFRPYLYQAIRNLAISCSRRSDIDSVAEFDDVAGPDNTEDSLTTGFDRSVMRSAFDGLPERWREVLWYAEVEGLKPRAYAHLLGVNPTAASQLARRARDGLRVAWLSAHLTGCEPHSACSQIVKQLIRYEEGALAVQDQQQIDAHLSDCQGCRDIASEARTMVRSPGTAIAIAVLGAGLAGALAPVLAPADSAVAAETAPPAGVEPTLLPHTTPAGRRAVTTTLLAAAGGLVLLLAASTAVSLIAGSAEDSAAGELSTVSAADPPGSGAPDTLPGDSSDPSPRHGHAGPEDASRPEDRSGPGTPGSPAPDEVPGESTILVQHASVAPLAAVTQVAHLPDGGLQVLGTGAVPGSAIGVRITNRAGQSAGLTVTAAEDGGWSTGRLGGLSPIGVSVQVQHRPSGAAASEWRTVVQNTTLALWVDQTRSASGWTLGGWPGAHWALHPEDPADPVLTGVIGADGYARVPVPEGLSEDEHAWRFGYAVDGRLVAQGTLSTPGPL